MSTIRVGTCLMTGLKGPSLSPEERDFIVSKGISGLILFKRNIESFRQIHHLCSEIKSLFSPPPLIAIDMEGGRVHRFSHLKESPLWPAPEVLGQLRPSQVFEIARLMGKQLRCLGIDINFAPVIDLPVLESPLLKGRLFASSPQEVKKFAEAFLDGLLKENIIPCLKHFPGHGGVREDSHETLPKDPRSLEELSSQLDLFQSLWSTRPGTWVMTAHVVFSNIEKESGREKDRTNQRSQTFSLDLREPDKERAEEARTNQWSRTLQHSQHDRERGEERDSSGKSFLPPASFSPFLLKEVLREKMGFKGLLVSDDADMGALKAFAPKDRFFKAIKGGCDLLICGQDFDNAQKLIQSLEEQPTQVKELQASGEKLLKLREKRAACPQVSFSSARKELQDISRAYAALEKCFK